MNPLQSAMSPGIPVYIHFTLLSHAPKQVCLKHYIYMSHCTTTVVKIYIPYYCTYQSKNNKLVLLLTKLFPYMCLQQTCPSNAKYMSQAEST